MDCWGVCPEGKGPHLFVVATVDDLLAQMPRSTWFRNDSLVFVPTVGQPFPS